jgi:hypothetical protein
MMNLDGKTPEELGKPAPEVDGVERSLDSLALLSSGASNQ